MTEVIRSAEADRSLENRFSWPGPEGEDIVTFRDTIETGLARLLSETRLDFSGWPETDPVTGRYEVSSSETEGGVSAGLALEASGTGGDGPNLALKSHVEMGTVDGKQFAGARLTVSLSSGPNAEDGDQGSIAVTSQFDLDPLF